MLHLGRVRLLVELDRRETVAAVAYALDYTPSAGSQQLAQLEREIGRPLLERIGRGVRLTDAGRALVAHGVELLARAEAAESELSGAAAVAGTLRIGAFQTAASGLVTPALGRLAASHPELTCELNELDAEVALPHLRSGRLDLVVAEEYEHAPRPRPAELVRVDLLDDELLVALPPSHRLAGGRRPLRLSALASERWVIGDAGTAFADMIVRTCRSVGGFEPDVRHHAGDMQTLLELASAGLAVTIVPALGR